jgi:hypothetical protein
MLCRSGRALSIAVADSGAEAIAKMLGCRLVAFFKERLMRGQALCMLSPIRSLPAAHIPTFPGFPSCGAILSHLRAFVATKLAGGGYPGQRKPWPLPCGAETQ